MSWEYIRKVFNEWADKKDTREGFATRDGKKGNDYCAFTAINTNPVYNGIRIVLRKGGSGDLEIYSTSLINLSELKSYCNDNGFKITPRCFVKPYGSVSYDDINTEQALLDLLKKIRTYFKDDLAEIQKIVDSHPKLSSDKKERNNNRPTVSSPSESRQIIYFGAPGTSKSYTLNKDAEKIANQERVTFYPGYSYQQFVGTYKPCMVKSKDEDKGEGEDKIAYKFVPGPLLRLLEKALKAEKAKAEKAETQDKNKEDTPAAQTSTENQENGQEEKNMEKFLLIVEELNRAEAAAVFGDLFQLLDRNSDGESEYPISVSEDLKQYLRRGTDKTDEKDRGVWADVPEDEQKKLYFPSNFYIWATMNSADQGVFPLDTAFKRRWDFKYFGINDAEKELKKGVPQFWNNLRTTINDALQKKLTLNEDKLLGPFFMKVENIDEQTFWERFCSKVLLYLYEDAARLKRSQIFKDKTYSEIYNAFKKIDSETLQETWNDVFRDVELKLNDNEYPWPKAKAETEEGTSSASKADGNEIAGEPGTDNSDEMTNEQ